MAASLKGYRRAAGQLTTAYQRNHSTNETLIRAEGADTRGKVVEKVMYSDRTMEGAQAEQQTKAETQSHEQTRRKSNVWLRAVLNL